MDTRIDKQGAPSLRRRSNFSNNYGTTGCNRELIKKVQLMGVPCVCYLFFHCLLSTLFVRPEATVKSLRLDNRISAGLVATSWKSVQVSIVKGTEALSESTTMPRVWVGLKVSKMASPCMMSC